jgi:inner membrane protein YidH
MGDLKTDLAIERTILAHERTLMAWVRTATSLISFGFTIYKFFDYLRDSNQLASAPRHLFGPRAFATGMIAVGLIALVLAILEHHRSRALLAAGGARMHRSLALVVAVFVAALGIGGLILVVSGN